MRSAAALRRVTMGPVVFRVSAVAAMTTRPATANSRLPLPPIAPRQQRRRSLFAATAASAAASSPASSSSSPASSSSSAADADPFARFAEAQAALPRPSLAEEARTLLASAKTGVLSTASAGVGGGHPSGSVVQFALLEEGASSAAAPGSSPPRRRCAPVLALSSLSAHTRDLATDPRCSLTVLSPGFAGMEDGRVSLACVARRLPEGQGAAGEEQRAARACYRQKHPDAFWSDFGDFSWWRLDPVGGEEGAAGEAAAEGEKKEEEQQKEKKQPGLLPAARVVMGFGRAGSLSARQLAEAAPDPVSPFSAPVAGHMNADPGDAVLAMARSATGLGERVARAAMGRVDRLGFEVELVLASGGGEGGDGGSAAGARPQPPSRDSGGERVRARVAFPQPAEDRKALKDRLVEMTKAAKATASG